MFRRLCISILIAGPACMFAADKSILELQRELASLEEQVKQLQQSQDKALAIIQTLAQQSLDASQKSNTSVAAIQSGLQQSLRDLETKVVTPVAGLSTRMDQVSGDVRTLAQAVSDLTNTIGKIQSQLTDLNNAVKVLAAPPTPPPAQTGPGGVPPQAAEVPPINSSALYDNALRDKNTGKLDIALQEFSDYLKWYGNTDYAPNAQFYIGFIHYSQKAYDIAANDFELVLQKYPDSNKAQESMYYEGLSLVGANQRQKAVSEFNDAIRKTPGNDTAAKACLALKDLGMHCPAPAAAPKGSAISKRKKPE